MSKLDEILQELNAHREVIRSMGVRELAVFGSFACADPLDDSDLDFLVDFEEKTFDAYMDLKFFLEDLFHRPVDLVLKDAIKPRLRASIEESAVYASGL